MIDATMRASSMGVTVRWGALARSISALACGPVASSTATASSRSPASQAARNRLKPSMIS
jgi:hypothetical protein